MRVWDSKLSHFSSLQDLTGDAYPENPRPRLGEAKITRIQHPQVDLKVRKLGLQELLDFMGQRLLAVHTLQHASHVLQHEKLECVAVSQVFELLHYIVEDVVSRILLPFPEPQCGGRRAGASGDIPHHIFKFFELELCHIAYFDVRRRVESVQCLPTCRVFFDDLSGIESNLPPMMTTGIKYNVLIKM